MAASQPESLVAALIGITLSTGFVSVNLAISSLAVPTLLLPAPSKSDTNAFPKSPTPSVHLARQWLFIYDHAKPVAIASSLISSASFIYAALQLPDSHSTQRNLFYASASLAVFVMPYTLTLMNPTNFALMERAEAGNAMTEVGEEHVKGLGMAKAQGLSGYRTDELLNRWSMLNYGRAAIPFVGIGCAIAALVW